MIGHDDRARRRHESLPPAWRRLIQSRYGLVLLGLLFLLILGVVTLTDYGASMDEHRNLTTGRLFLQAYQGGGFLRSPDIEYFNGPFYFMVFTVTSRLFHTLHRSWLLTDGLHLTNFITFLLGVFLFYRIALRLMPRGVALFVTALFITQPVLFGHGFINQKDTPLMVFFLASVELGWAAVESRLMVERRGSTEQEGPLRRAGVALEWRRLSLARRGWIGVGGFLGVIVLLDLWWLGGVQDGAQGLLGKIYSGNGPGFIVGLFRWIAEDAYKTPLSAYVAKVESFFAWWRIVVSVGVVAGLLGLLRHAVPESYANTLGKGFRHWGLVVVAGIVLGLTTSIRAVAPFAGVLVAAYWIGRSGRRATAGLVVYGGVAAVTTYLTWPVLWGNPLVGLAHRVSELPTFAEFHVRFWGTLYFSGDLPWQYVPSLLAIQLTLPAVVVFLVGVPYSWALSKLDRSRRLMVALVWIWFGVPVVAVMVGLTPIYNNFRHILFAVPPAFLIMGFGAWKIGDALRAPIVRAGLVVVALAPGVLGIVRLHPYEYIYYNELVGGVRGADGRFELDYWCTGLREAMTVVNTVAGPEARVESISNYVDLLAPFAREDLELVQETQDVPDPDFAIACRRGPGKSVSIPEMETLYEVRADGALLATVGKRREGE